MTIYLLSNNLYNIFRQLEQPFCFGIRTHPAVLMRMPLIERIFTIKLINGLLIVMLVLVAVKKQNRCSIHQKGQTADNQIVTKIAKTKWGAGGLITNVKSTVYLSVTKVQQPLSPCP